MKKITQFLTLGLLSENGMNTKISSDNVKENKAFTDKEYKDRKKRNKQSKISRRKNRK